MRHKVPFEKIEEVAQYLLGKFAYIDYGGNAAFPIDLEKLIEIDLKINLRFLSASHDPSEWCSDPARAVPDRNEIWIGTARDAEDGPFRTILAHELGHVILHKFESMVENDQFVLPSFETTMALSPNRRIVEQEAWDFAVCIALPRSPFSSIVHAVSEEYPSISSAKLVRMVTDKCQVSEELTYKALRRYAILSEFC